MRRERQSTYLIETNWGIATLAAQSDPLKDRVVKGGRGGGEEQKNNAAIAFLIETEKSGDTATFLKFRLDQTWKGEGRGRSKTHLRTTPRTCGRKTVQSTYGQRGQTGKRGREDRNT